MQELEMHRVENVQITFLDTEPSLSKGQSLLKRRPLSTLVVPAAIAEMVLMGGDSVPEVVFKTVLVGAAAAVTSTFDLMINRSNPR